MTICNACDLPSRFYQGDVGTALIVDTCNDITTATVTNLLVQKPDLSMVTWVGTVFETTKIRYTIQAGDFDQAGEYRLQSYVEMPSWVGRGDTAIFKVTKAFQ